MTEIRNRDGRIIGWTEERGNCTYLLEANGRQIGHYNHDLNETRDRDGCLVGKGNLLMTLLQD